MADFGRLRQPGGARRENPECAIGQRYPREPTWIERIAALRRNREVNPANVRPTGAVDPHLDALLAHDSLHAGSGIFRGDDHAARARDCQSMNERRSPKTWAEERDDRADLDQAEPDREILGAIAHHESDGLSWRDPRVQSPARVLIHSRLESAEAEGLPVAEERWGVTISAGPVRDRARQDPVGIAGREPDRFERARPILRGRRFSGVAGIRDRGQRHVRCLGSAHRVCAAVNPSTAARPCGFAEAAPRAWSMSPMMS